jgi:N-acetyl-anhydromuramyl-L-alanine amidase AmpD
VLESEENNDTTKAMIQELKDRIEEYSYKYPMGSLNTRKHTEDSRKTKRKHTDGNASTGGTAAAEDATGCAELAAYGYEVEPGEIVDEKGNAMITFSKVRQPPSTYTPPR